MVLGWFRRNRNGAKDTVLEEPRGPPGPGPDEVGFLSRFSYSWLDPLIVRGARRQLDPEDLWDMPATEKAGARETEFSTTAEKLYEKNKAKIREKGGDENDAVKPSINKVLIAIHTRKYLLAMVLMLVSQVYNLAAPTLIQQITIYLQDENVDRGLGYLYVAILAVGQWVGIGVCQSHSFMIMYEVGINARSALISAVYRKSTNLSNGARQNLTVGEVVNLMSNDTQRYVEVTQFLQQLWSGPFVIIFGLVLLIRLIGVSALAGLALMIITIPLQGKMFMWAGQLRREVMVQSDVRVKLMNEVLQGVKAIKIYAWEESFKEKIGDVRAKEIRAIFKTALLRGLNFGLFSALPSLIAIVSLVVYSAQGNPLSADIVFPAIAYLNVLRFPLLLLPMLITQLAQLKVSTKRLEGLFSLEEMNETDRTWENSQGANKGGSVDIEDGVFSWKSVHEGALSDIKGEKKKTKKKSRSLFRRGRKTESTPEASVESLSDQENMANDGFELHDINFRVQPGEFVAVVGAVGNGKSSLISAILGEMTKDQGSVTVSGSVAYAAQTPWIFNSTMRSNITFNRQFDEKQYSKTIASTSLASDIDVLPAGDQTEIGEKGINLSGGQKQRVSVARAVYADADIYILDDPLSAVDAHVGEHMFKECFMKQLRKKTRILVTNQMQFLPYADRVYVMKEGRIVEMGTYEELNKDGTVLQKFMQAFGTEINATVTKYNTEYSEAEKEEGGAIGGKNHQDGSSHMGNEEPGKDGHLTSLETRNQGGISRSVWLDYFRAGGGVVLGFAIILLYMLSQVSNMSPDIWLTYWSNQFESDQEGTQARLGFFAGIYGALGVILGILAVSRSVAFSYFSTTAAKNLHNDMLSNIMRAPMTFFDTTPLGRVLNRFSKDTDTTDILLPPLMDNQFFLMLNMIGIYILIAVYLPWFLIAVPFILLLYYGVQYYYRRTSRELQRIESVQRSPIYAHFSESLSGASTLRAYGRTDEAREQNRVKQDEANAAFYLLQTAMRWLQFRLEMVSLTILLVVGCLVVASRDNSSIGLTASQAGLLLTYTLSTTNVTNFMVRGAVELEAKLTSVERQMEYIRDVKPEAEPVVEDNRPPEDWPQNGHVEFENVEMRYREELDLVLKGVSVAIEPLWKVGIAGRTGSGKSSLAVALFRLVEKSAGRVVIDGIDTSTIGLKDLRSKIGMIPQDPIIFSGTVRFNVDPFNKKSDDELWNALELVQLKDVVSNLDGQLDATVAEGGENFSVGQRQLFCIARALLRNPKVLLLDEATANVDVETDALIQSTIRSQFKNCTMLTIAHRINTIIDSDRVLVMDDGRVAEFDAPQNLLNISGSIFGGLVGAQQNTTTTTTE